MTEQNPYSTNKVAWHGGRVEALRAGKTIAPVGIQLILSDLCNQSCEWCAYRADDGLSSAEFGVLRPDGTINHNPNRMIPLAKVQEIINDASYLGVKSITFTGGGEPTVHPQHLELFDLAMSLGLDCSLNTNGMLLRDGWEEILPRMKYVRFSIDSGDPDEYARTRSVKPSDYWKVLDNLAAVTRAVDRRGSGCVVGVGYVVSPETWKNLEKGVENIKAAGASYVRLASMQSTKGLAAYSPENLEGAREAIKFAKMLETDSFKVVDLFDSAMGRVMEDPFCGFQHFVTYIGANLKIYRCCYTAYTKLGEMGDLSNTRLADWYLNGSAKERLRDFDARSCDSCPLADKNAAIASLMGPEPVHVNFI